jgi:hypothetical protein
MTYEDTLFVPLAEACCRSLTPGPSPAKLERGAQSTTVFYRMQSFMQECPIYYHKLFQKAMWLQVDSKRNSVPSIGNCYDNE